MRKKITVFYLFCVLVIAGWLIAKSFTKLKEKEHREVSVSSLPHFTFKILSGEAMSLSSTSDISPVTLVLFNSECDHCQYEARSISPFTSIYPETKFIFLSEEPMERIASFKEEHFGQAAPNVIFGQVSIIDLHETFGSISYPNIFIYSNEGKLLKEFKGETKPEAIIKYLE